MTDIVFKIPAPLSKAAKIPILRLTVLILFQTAILWRASATGLGHLAFFPTLFFIVPLDIFSFVLRLKSQYRLSAAVAYAPPTLLAFGAGIQAAAAIFSKVPRVHMHALTQHLVISLLAFAAAFFLFDKAVQCFKIRAVRITAVALCFVIYLLTIAIGSGSGANVTLFGYQLHEYAKIVFIFVFAYLLDSGYKVNVKLLFLALFMTGAAACLALMSEYGSLLLFVTAAVITLAAMMDMTSISLFFSKFFDLIKKLLSKRRNLIIFSVTIAVMLILTLIFHRPIGHFFDILTQKFVNKFQERVYPWLGLSSGEHHDKLAKAIRNGSLLGIGDIKHTVNPPYFENDCSFAMLIQLFGMLGGLLALGLYAAFAYFGQREIAKSTASPTRSYALVASLLLSCHCFIAIGSAVNLFPIIGITTPFLSSGGLSSMITFMMVGMILREAYQASMSPTYEARSSAFAVAMRRPREKRGRQKSQTSFVVRTVALSLVMLILLTALFSLLYVNSKIDYVFENANRSPFLVENIADAPVEEVADIPLPDDDDVYNLLLIGTDMNEARTKKNKNPLADVMILLSLNKKSNKLQMYSIQRDNYVEMPDGRKGKLNAAYSGGANMLIATIRNNFRVPIHNYAQIDMTGFQNIIEAMGELELKVTKDEAAYLNKRTKDEARKLDMADYEAANTVSQKLDSKQALDYVRARYIDGQNDFNRTQRQRKAIVAMVKQLGSYALHFETDAVDRSMTALAESVTTDMDKETFDDILPSLLLAVKPFLDDKDTTQRTIPNGYHYDFFELNNVKHMQPRLRENVTYLHQEIYGIKTRYDKW